MIGGNRMFRGWKLIFLSMLSVILLVGCSASLDEKADDGVKAAKEAFNSNSVETTDTIDGITLFKPIGFKVSESSDEQNIVFTKNNETYILFVNPNEGKGSHFFYDLLLTDSTKEIITEESFTNEGVFGFAAVIKSDTENVELVASVGGAKITTLTSQNKIKEDLARMMEIVRSIK